MHERVRELLRTGRVLVFVGPSTTVRETAEIMDRHNVGSVLIIDDSSRLVGIFTERDLLKRVVVARVDTDKTAIRDVMTPDVVVVDSKMSADDVFALMDQRKCRHVPVSEGDKILGVVSMRDLLRRDRQMKELEINEMRSYFLDARYPG